MEDEDLKSKRVVSIERFEPPSSNLKSHRKVVSVEKLEPPRINQSSSSQHLGNIESKVPKNTVANPDTPDNFKRGKPLHELLSADVKTNVEDTDKKVASVQAFEPREVRRNSSIGTTATSKSEKNKSPNPHKKKIAKVEEFVLPTNKLQSQKSNRKMSTGSSDSASGSRAKKMESEPIHLPVLGSHTASSPSPGQCAAGVDRSPNPRTPNGAESGSPQTLVVKVEDVCSSPTTTRRSGNGIKARRINLARLNDKFAAHSPLPVIAPTDARGSSNVGANLLGADEEALATANATMEEAASDGAAANTTMRQESPAGEPVEAETGEEGPLTINVKMEMGSLLESETMLLEETAHDS
jgi:hypothetical protein